MKSLVNSEICKGKTPSVYFHLSFLLRNNSEKVLEYAAAEGATFYRENPCWNLSSSVSEVDLDQESLSLRQTALCTV